MFFGIESSKDWKNVDKISKGWSSDEKYIITTKDNEKLLLRISDISKYQTKEKEFKIIKKYSLLQFNMSQPIEFGVCNNNKNVYMILSWIEGKDLEEVLPSLSKEEQYLLGRKAGNILKKIHSLSIDIEDNNNKSIVEKKLMKIQKYEESKVRIPNDESIIKFIKENINYINNETKVYQHGDFHPGNLIFLDSKEIGVIDFNRWDVGDPYEEFYKLESFGVDISIPYCIGQIEGYFDDNIPQRFWKSLAVYSAHAALYSIKWAEQFGEDDLNNMIKICYQILDDYNNFKNDIPKWYKNIANKVENKF
ncbi:MAG: aminoglycoside phosphotransferase family protein [Bacilli bacterium]